MGYLATPVTLQEAWASVYDYTYALLYKISEIRLCKTAELTETDLDECMEARFFSDSMELHLFEYQDEMRAVRVSDTDEKDIVIKEYELDSRFRTVGNVLLVQEYIEYDTDGQAFAGLTRLKGVRHG